MTLGALLSELHDLAARRPPLLDAQVLVQIPDAPDLATADRIEVVFEKIAERADGTAARFEIGVVIR